MGFKMSSTALTDHSQCMCKSSHHICMSCLLDQLWSCEGTSHEERPLISREFRETSLSLQKENTPPLSTT